MQLGFENKRKAMVAGGLGVVALLVFVFEILPMFTGPSSGTGSSAQAAAPVVAEHRVSAGASKSGKSAKKIKTESLDPTLQLDLRAKV